MGIGRTILAVVVAFSVAMLPIAGGVGQSLKSTGMMDMSVLGEMSAAQHMPDCCPPEAAPCDKANGDRMSMAACASTCCSFLVPASSALVVPSVPVETMPLLESHVFRSQSNNPPFRPPRV